MKVLRSTYDGQVHNWLKIVIALSEGNARQVCPARERVFSFMLCSEAWAGINRQ